MTCWSGSSPAVCISIRVTATLSVMSGSLSLQSSRSIVVVFGLEECGSEDVGYGYVIRIITVFYFTFDVDFCQRSACLCLF
jgi:hypothetical protein